ncbi:TetR/AcrR family transcriptional regulator [Actinomadura fibrosa]|uniref:TetR/AcrR family transcriptional regulator n=1 Tax=Actinomadura fibrosa TaxID=111802 RepID=A0ABW2Y2D9_9ACTN|nr:TetR/AcrR family transcriptional regulator [Actinomadura fibrosa]
MYHRYIAAKEASSAQRTRVLIIDAAADLLAASASGDFSTREVCDAAGVAAPTLYHHFGDKDGLLREVAADRFSRYLTRKQALEATGDPVEDFLRGWDMHVEFGVTNPALYTIMYGRPMDGRTGPADHAHAVLVTKMRDLERAGRLRIPAETAADMVASAAVGVTLHLIRTRAAADDHLSAIVRDAVTAAVISPPAVPGAPPVTPQLVRAAARLEAEMPHGPVGTLRASETTLLREWLAQLSALSSAAGGDPP